MFAPQIPGSLDQYVAVITQEEPGFQLLSLISLIMKQLALLKDQAKIQELRVSISLIDVTNQTLIITVTTYDGYWGNSSSMLWLMMVIEVIFLIIVVTDDGN